MISETFDADGLEGLVADYQYSLERAFEGLEAAIEARILWVKGQLPRLLNGPTAESLRSVACSYAKSSGASGCWTPTLVKEIPELYDAFLVRHYGIE